MKVAFLIPITSNGKNWESIEESYLYIYTLETFIKTVDNSLECGFYIGFDLDDIFFNNDINIYKLKQKLKSLKLNLNITLFKNIKKGHLTKMWNILFKKAYLDSYDYFYQCGDDISFNTNGWLNDSIKKLKENNNLGVAGPRNIFTRNLLTQALVSRRHMEIFGFLFPESIDNYYCDDWLSDVYKPNNFFILENHTAINQGGDPRYDIQHDKTNYLRELEIGKKIPEQFTNIQINNLQNMNKKYLITFGGGGENYYDAVKRLKKQAEDFNMFEKIYDFTDLDLKKDDKFWNEHKNFILLNSRGYGYWIWKAFIIKKVLDQINLNDIILYLDCGCELNIDGIEKLREYFKIVESKNLFAFQIKNLEKLWTKEDLFDHMKTKNEDKETGQIEANVIFLKKTIDNINFINEWYKLKTMNNYHFVNDSPSKLKNDPGFIENRHDQSCFSLLMKKYKKYYINQETFFSPNWENGLKYPIWTLRNKTGISKLYNYKL